MVRLRPANIRVINRHRGAPIATRSYPRKPNDHESHSKTEQLLTGHSDQDLVAITTKDVPKPSRCPRAIQRASRVRSLVSTQFTPGTMQNSRAAHFLDIPVSRCQKFPAFRKTQQIGKMQPMNWLKYSP
jgi:hypothetical protein